MKQKLTALERSWILYDIGKITDLTAGMTFSLFGITLQNENIAVATLLINFLLGYILFHKADKLNHARIQAK